MKVKVRYLKNGKERMMTTQYAGILLKMGVVEIIGNDLDQSSEPTPEKIPERKAEKKVEEKPPVSNQPDPAVPADNQQNEQGTLTGTLTGSESAFTAPTDIPAPAQILISETVQQFANENSVDVSTITGTGQNGRILKSDVQAVIDARTKTN